MSTSNDERVQLAYQQGVQAAATALALMVRADYSPDQVARSVQGWLASHGQTWEPTMHGFGGAVSRSDLAAAIDTWYERYRSADRIDEDVYLALRNRLIPLSPGWPVQFRELGRRRWLNGTFEGPVANPDDPRRMGDVIVIRDSHSPVTDGRVAVFLSSVRRRAR